MWKPLLDPVPFKVSTVANGYNQEDQTTEGHAYNFGSLINEETK